MVLGLGHLLGLLTENGQALAKWNVKSSSQFPIARAQHRRAFLY